MTKITEDQPEYICLDWLRAGGRDGTTQLLLTWAFNVA